MSGHYRCSPQPTSSQPPQNSQNQGSQSYFSKNIQASVATNPKSWGLVLDKYYKDINSGITITKPINPEKIRADKISAMRDFNVQRYFDEQRYFDDEYLRSLQKKKQLNQPRNKFWSLRIPNDGVSSAGNVPNKFGTMPKNLGKVPEQYIHEQYVQPSAVNSLRKVQNGTVQTIERVSAPVVSQKEQSAPPTLKPRNIAVVEPQYYSRNSKILENSEINPWQQSYANEESWQPNQPSYQVTWQQTPQMSWQPNDRVLSHNVVYSSQGQIHGLPQAPNGQQTVVQQQGLPSQQEQPMNEVDNSQWLPWRQEMQSLQGQSVQIQANQLPGQAYQSSSQPDYFENMSNQLPSQTNQLPGQQSQFPGQPETNTLSQQHLLQQQKYEEEEDEKYSGLQHHYDWLKQQQEMLQQQEVMQQHVMSQQNIVAYNQQQPFGDTASVAVTTQQNYGSNTIGHVNAGYVHYQSPGQVQETSFISNDFGQGRNGQNGHHVRFTENSDTANLDKEKKLKKTGVQVLPMVPQLSIKRLQRQKNVVESPGSSSPDYVSSPLKNPVGEPQGHVKIGTSASSGPFVNYADQLPPLPPRNKLVRPVMSKPVQSPYGPVYGNSEQVQFAHAQAKNRANFHTGQNSENSVTNMNSLVHHERFRSISPIVEYLNDQVREITGTLRSKTQNRQIRQESYESYDSENTLPVTLIL